MRTSAGAMLVIVGLIGTAVPAVAEHAILGGKFVFAEKPGFPQTRKISVKSKEATSPDALVGDPLTNGATVQIIVLGAISTSHTITLPPGARWRRSPSDPLDPVKAWKYAESRRLGLVSPVTKLKMARSSGGTFKLDLTLTGRYVPLDIAAPNPGTYAGVVITLGGGDTYCTNFAGAAGGSIARNDAVSFRVYYPTIEGTCPSGAATCGDDVIESPFETCDGTNDAACPGLCGTNGLPCLCPFCGDSVIDAGEACDRSASGTCAEGCSYACTCTTCGNAVTERPAEGCESSDECSAGVCAPPGAPNQCQCPYCGDGIVNLAAEQCDGADDAACPGTCVDSACLCAVCGNGQHEPGEQCDGSDDSDCPGLCTPACTCP